MLELLENLWEIIYSCGRFIVSLITSLIQTLAFLPNIISSLNEAIRYLPPVLVLFATLSMTLLILNYIIGRN